MAYKVKKVADLVGVSIRTLHHYDQIGLLVPQSVNPSGYRFYTDSELERLQQILFFREIGFSLQEIKGILDSPEFVRKQASEAHIGEKETLKNISSRHPNQIVGN